MCFLFTFKLEKQTDEKHQLIEMLCEKIHNVSATSAILIWCTVSLLLEIEKTTIESVSFIDILEEVDILINLSLVN